MDIDVGIIFYPGYNIVDTAFVQILLSFEFIDTVFALNEGIYRIIRKAECIYFTIARNQILLELRVQTTQLLDVDVADIGYLLQMQILVDMNGIRDGR